MEANHSSAGEETWEKKPILVGEAATPSGRTEKALFQQPTADEVSGVVFAKLRDLRVHAQEARNYFAHLLNRGSSLE